MTLRNTTLNKCIEPNKEFWMTKKMYLKPTLEIKQISST